MVFLNKLLIFVQTATILKVGTPHGRFPQSLGFISDVWKFGEGRQNLGGEWVNYLSITVKSTSQISFLTKAIVKQSTVVHQEKLSVPCFVHLLV